MKTVKSMPPIAISPNEIRPSHRLIAINPKTISKGKTKPVIIVKLKIRSILGRNINSRGMRTGSIRFCDKALVTEAIPHLHKRKRNQTSYYIIGIEAARVTRQLGRVEPVLRQDFRYPGLKSDCWPVKAFKICTQHPCFVRTTVDWREKRHSL